MMKPIVNQGLIVKTQPANNNGSMGVSNVLKGLGDIASDILPKPEKLKVKTASLGIRG